MFTRLTKNKSNGSKLRFLVFLPFEKIHFLTFMFLSATMLQ